MERLILRIVLFITMLCGVAYAQNPPLPCGTTQQCLFCYLDGKDLVIANPFQKPYVLPKKPEDFWTISKVNIGSITYILNCGQAAELPLDENIYMLVIGAFGAWCIWRTRPTEKTV